MEIRTELRSVFTRGHHAGVDLFTRGERLASAFLYGNAGQEVRFYGCDIGAVSSQLVTMNLAGGKQLSVKSIKYKYIVSGGFGYERVL